MCQLTSTFYLTREKAIEKDSSLSSYEQKILPIHPSKRQEKEKKPLLPRKLFPRAIQGL